MFHLKLIFQQIAHCCRLRVPAPSRNVSNTIQNKSLPSTVDLVFSKYSSNILSINHLIPLGANCRLGKPPLVTIEPGNRFLAGGDLNATFPLGRPTTLAPRIGRTQADLPERQHPEGWYSHRYIRCQQLVVKWVRVDCKRKP